MTVAKKSARPYRIWAMINGFYVEVGFVGNAPTRQFRVYGRHLINLFGSPDQVGALSRGLFKSCLLIPRWRDFNGAKLLYFEAWCHEEPPCPFEGRRKRWIEMSDVRLWYNTFETFELEHLKRGMDKILKAQNEGEP